jgi:site-specific DNA recombinase
LSGILVCGVCQTPMVVRPRGGAPRYVCNVDSRPAVACGRLSVDGAFADRVVRDMALVALESDEFRDRLYARAQVDPAIRTALADDEGRLVELAEEWADPHSHMTRGEWRAAREKIETRLANNRRILQRAVDTLPLVNLTGSYQELLPEWERRNVSQQRAIVSRLLTKVVVTPARQKFDIGRFHPEWRA